MSMKFMRKSAVAVAATALLGGGLAVGVGQGVAGAEGSLGSSGGGVFGCQPSSSTTVKVGVIKRNFTVTQTASKEVAPGGELTVTTSIKDDGAAVNLKRLRVNVPAGSTLVSFERAGKDVTSDALSNEPDAGAFSSDSTTSTVGGPVSYKVTVKVPEDLEPGSTFNVGAGFSVALGSNNDWNSQDTGACVSVRSKNATESVFGSLDDLGLGSVEDGVDGVTGSATDPTGSIADVINQIDIGKIIGGVIGGAVGS